MNKVEIQTFIEEMEAIGDIWTAEQVERCYGSISLDEALNIRRTEMGQFLSTLGATAIYLASKKDDE